MLELNSPAISMLGELLKNFDDLHSQYGHEPSFDMVMSIHHFAVVVRYHDFAFYVNSNDHPPPHFHVRWKGEDVAFSIKTGKRLRGHKSLKGRDEIIKTIWNIGKHDFAIAWNNTRPSDQLHQLFAIPNAWGIAPTEVQQKESMFEIRFPEPKKIRNAS